MIIPLAQLPASQLPALAALHSQTMPTLLTRLGADFVLHYYQLAQKDASALALVAQPAPGALPLAYAVGSPHPGRLNAGLRQPLGRFVSRLTGVALRHPLVLLDLAQSVLFSSPANQLPSGAVELTYIGVAPQARGKGLGGQILQAFLQAARAAGYSAAALSVETDNAAAIALYTRAGFHITQTFQEASYHRHRMEYCLPQ